MIHFIIFQSPSEYISQTIPQNIGISNAKNKVENLWIKYLKPLRYFYIISNLDLTLQSGTLALEIMTVLKPHTQFLYLLSLLFKYVLPKTKNQKPKPKSHLSRKNLKVSLFCLKALHNFKAICSAQRTNLLASYTTKSLNLWSKLLFKSHLTLNFSTSQLSCNTNLTKSQSVYQRHELDPSWFCLRCSLCLNSPLLFLI